MWIITLLTEVNSIYYTNQKGQLCNYYSLYHGN